jgi:deazaflavin-dependent oxidoreductase (nitroreductase family)
MTTNTASGRGPAVPHPVLYRLVRTVSPLMRPLAGRRYFPLWAVLHHRGRRTGREYAAPVGARVAPDGFYIALPFGDRTQWAQNVLAAGGGRLRWRGENLSVTEPTMIEMDAAIAAFPAIQRWMMRVFGVTHVLHVRCRGAWRGRQ